MGAIEHKRTAGRGNAGKREGRSEKIALAQGRDVDAQWTARRRHTHITYTTGRCGYRYSDGARCVWEGELTDDMCREHRWITLNDQRLKARAAEQRRRRADGPRDHTAPWHCGLSGCKGCAGKPSHRRWLKERETG